LSLSQNSINRIIMRINMTHTSEDRIAIIGPKGIPKDFFGSGGVETYVEQQLLNMVKEGKQITCYVRRWASRPYGSSYRGIKRIILPTINTTSLDTLSYSFLASLHASVSKANIVWYHGIGPSFFSFIPKLFGKRVYTTIHALDWKREKWGIFAQLFLRLCERVTLIFSDKLFVVSTQLQIYYTHKHYRTIVEKYAVSLQPIVQPNIILHKYHLRKNTYVLYMGRFVPEKRIDWLIRASTKLPRLCFVLSGGTSHSDSYVQRLEKMPRSSNVIFTGYVLGREKAELLSNCKLFILPSALEGYPTSVAEAVGYKKRCLVGDFLRQEFSQKNKLLYYFKSDSFSDFIQHIRMLTK